MAGRNEETMRRKTRARLNFSISEVDRYTLKKTILSGSIFRNDNERRGPGWHELRGLVSGCWFECFDRFCRAHDEATQRAFWEIFREDILAAQKKHAPGTKIWALKFDKKRSTKNATQNREPEP
jgi:hypothetical protein